MKSNDQRICKADTSFCFGDRVSIMKVRLTFQLLMYITYKDPLSLLIGVAQGVHFV